MILTELPPPDLGRLTQQYTERSPGLHLSRITHDILCTIDPKRFGEMHEDRGDGAGQGAQYLRFLAGIMFERALEMAWLDLTLERGSRPELIRPGEIEVDGITGTADAYDTAIGQPEEYKCTKMSCRQSILDRKFWHYWVQLKAYAYMWGCNSGALWVLHLNGNYSWDDADPNSGYVIRGYQAIWTELELKENWWMMVQHARRRGWL